MRYNIFTTRCNGHFICFSDFNDSTGMMLYLPFDFVSTSNFVVREQGLRTCTKVVNFEFTSHSIKQGHKHSHDFVPNQFGLQFLLFDTGLHKLLNNLNVFIVPGKQAEDAQNRENDAAVAQYLLTWLRKHFPFVYCLLELMGSN
jgi:hypothetical protein